MKRDDTGTPIDCVEQGGDVGKTDERLGASRYRREIHPVEQPEAAVASPYAPNCIDSGILERRVKIGESLLVRAGQVAVALMGILSEDRFVIQRTAELLGPY